MSFKDALAKARSNRPEPVLQAVAVGDELYHVEIRRLDGMDWAAITADCPPRHERDASMGYDSNKAALIACRRHGRLLDGDDEPVAMAVIRDDQGNVVDDPWLNLFNAISGTEADAIAALWWGQNVNDPNKHVVALKKASAGGSKTN
ncbi:hypothetical protein MUN76_15365 [Leucobacter rhizosphaerae]|uniref:Rieske domain-containing protein n=1 Tax=Leucobacter rhizosphaerae TaxID=2932245 RepID=A0ABY4FVT5_9MICO|nr:hypothetical protein [Leucobacter rhizosphaerae]UOQ60387.1 hypothetical protein MUN76_15365 [Leucobacter rhizosphaerae]